MKYAIHSRYLAVDNNLPYIGHALNKDNNKKDLKIYINRQKIIISERAKSKPKYR